MPSTRRFLHSLASVRIRSALCRHAALLAAALAAWAAPAAGQVRIPVSVLEYSAPACQEARPRSGGDHARDSWCVRGLAQYRPGIAEVLVDGNRAVLKPDSSGGTEFTGFAPRDSSTQVVTVTLRGADGNVSEEKFRVTAGTDPAHPERQGYIVSNLRPRTLGEDPPGWTPPTRPAVPAATVAVAPGPAGGSPPAVGDSAAGARTAVAQDGLNPYIRILEPRAWSGMGRPEVLVSPPGRSVEVVGYAAHPNGVAAVEVDGAVAALTRDAGGEYRFSGFVPAEPGEHEVTVLVRGQSGLPVVEKYAMRVTPADSGGQPVQEFSGNRWAVVVGINAYQDTTLKRLQYAEADAKAFYDFLRSPQAGGNGFPEDHVKLLLNDQATFSGVREALLSFLRRSTANDQVVIYFAGHGAPDPQRSSDLYLLTYDTRQASMASTAFPMRDMERAVEELAARHVVLIVDACHSGAIASQDDSGTRGIGVAQANNRQLNQAFLTQLNKANGGLAVFSATRADQESKENAKWGGHGVFTSYLLQGLGGAADANNNHIVTLGELVQWTTERVSTETHGEQTPTVGRYSFDPFLPVSMVLDSAAPPPPPPDTANRVAPPSPSPIRISPALADSLAKAREAVGIFPNSAQYRGNLGRVLMHAGMTDEAITVFREAVRLDPQSSALQFDLAQALARAKQMPEATAAFEAAIGRDPNNAEYYAGYGMALMDAGDYALAVEKLRRAVRMQATSAPYQASLGRALLASHRARDAALALRLAVGIDGVNVAYRRELALALGEDNRADEAVAVLRDAARLAPDTADLQYRLGQLLQASHDLEGARAAFTAAVRVDSASADYHASLGSVLRDLDLKYEAILEFRASCRLAPREADHQYQLGMLFAGSNQADSALVHLQEAVRLAPDSARYHNGAGQALRKAGRPVEALQELIQAVRLDGNRADYQYDVAMMYLETGNNGDAAAALRRATTLDPNNREYANALRSLQRRTPR